MNSAKKNACIVKILNHKMIGNYLWLLQSEGQLMVDTIFRENAQS